jgi:hypothetical protein
MNAKDIHMSDESKDRGKKTYEPPRLTVISLRPEEAVLGNCKNASGGGPTPSCGNPLACNSHGS